MWLMDLHFYKASRWFVVWETVLIINFFFLFSPAECDYDYLPRLRLTRVLFLFFFPNKGDQQRQTNKQIVLCLCEVKGSNVKCLAHETSYHECRSLHKYAVPSVNKLILEGQERVKKREAIGVLEGCNTGKGERTTQKDKPGAKETFTGSITAWIMY